MKEINLNSLYTWVVKTDIYKHKHNYFDLCKIKYKHTLKREAPHHDSYDHCLFYVLIDGPSKLEYRWSGLSHVLR